MKKTMPTSLRNHVVFVLFDGLRPDLITPANTPNLCRLSRQGVMLERQRTVFPSETRIAMTSLVTGATPDRHGIVGNRYFDRSAAGRFAVNTADHRLIEKLDTESGGRLLGVPSLGEILAAHGRSLAVLASNSAGATRLFNHKARALGHATLSGHFPDVATSAELLDQVQRRFGPVPPAPPKGTPDLEAQRLLASTFLELVWPERRPDVTILSFSEPDTSSHYCGTAAAETRQALRFADEQFGRVLDWWEAEGRAEGVHLIVASDHGHVSVQAKADPVDALEAAGLRCGSGEASEVDIDAVVLPGQVGAIYLTDPTEEAIRRAVAAMMERPWCGPVFTAAQGDVEGVAPGSFARHLVFADHGRAADILFAYRSDSEADPFGLAGRTWSADWGIGLGVHGGLHSAEMAATGILAGTHFKRGVPSTTPSSIVDLAPTALRILGIAPPATMTGRVLSECLEQSVETPSVVEEVEEAGTGRYRQRLRRAAVGENRYVEGAEAQS